MTSKEQKLEVLKSHIDSLIDEQCDAVATAVTLMGRFNISESDFRKESVNLNVATFALGYLNSIKNVADSLGYKTAENFIRFHKYQIETKAAANEASVLKVAQENVVAILSAIINLYLDVETPSDIDSRLLSQTNNQ